MAKAANKLYSRGEIRNILGELANDESVLAMIHRDSTRQAGTHDDANCKFCERMKGRIETLRNAIEHFGGRPREAKERNTR